jgi:alkylation response protein AidB-like acyl-CoA dehydrogenase
MGHYQANLRDIEFCLFDLLDRESILGKSIYSDLDRATAMGMLEEVKRLCENDLAASFVEGDRKGTDFNKATGDVKLPESFKKSYKAYVDGEWGKIDVPVELGGTAIPPSVRWAIAEILTCRICAGHRSTEETCKTYGRPRLGSNNDAYRA